LRTLQPASATTHSRHTWRQQPPARLFATLCNGVVRSIFLLLSHIYMLLLLVNQQFQGLNCPMYPAWPRAHSMEPIGCDDAAGRPRTTDGPRSPPPWLPVRATPADKLLRQLREPEWIATWAGKKARSENGLATFETEVSTWSSGGREHSQGVRCDERRRTTHRFIAAPRRTSR